MAKKAFALRLDEAMLTALQRWADDEFRSVNGQIEFLLHAALLQSGRGKKHDLEQQDAASQTSADQPADRSSHDTGENG